MKTLTTLLMILVVQASFASTAVLPNTDVKKSIYNNYLLNHDDSGMIEKNKKMDCNILKEKNISSNQTQAEEDDSGLIATQSSTLSAGCRAEGSVDSQDNSTDYL